MDDHTPDCTPRGPAATPLAFGRRCRHGGVRSLKGSVGDGNEGEEST